MGGRRAGSLGNVVGTGAAVSGAKGELSRAVSSESPERIVKASVDLLASSRDALDSLRLGLKLAPFVSKNAARLKRVSDRTRNEAIRQAWSDIKRKEGIQTTREVDNAVVNAALATFKRRRGG